ncbi:hypothetical protein TNCT_32611 [Trichonephila clavata]|uniref:Uncharacterized protein n=1 Tax=Trichonephila clavata TaxID=2740835 RepID=A0A8X6IW23_TRICU|nr:hypothetical protein TNCT_32611 [Trichonephila clavata]
MKRSSQLAMRRSDDGVSWFCDKFTPPDFGRILNSTRKQRPAFECIAKVQSLPRPVKATIKQRYCHGGIFSSATHDVP